MPCKWEGDRYPCEYDDDCEYCDWWEEEPEAEEPQGPTFPPDSLEGRIVGELIEDCRLLKLLSFPRPTPDHFEGLDGLIGTYSVESR